MEDDKPKRGRPITVGTKGNKEYFRQYYHATKKTEICECGVTICTKARSKHIQSKLHNNLIKNRDGQELEEPPLNMCNII